MPIAVEETSPVATTGAPGTLAVARPPGFTAASAGLLIAGTDNSTFDDPPIGISGAGWVPVAQLQTGSDDRKGVAWLQFGPPDAETTLTVAPITGPNADDIGAIYYRVEGVDQANPIDAIGTPAVATTSGGANQTVPSTIVTVAPGALVFCVLVFDGADGSNPVTFGSDGVGANGWGSLVNAQSDGGGGGVTLAVCTKLMAAPGDPGPVELDVPANDGTGWVMFALAPASGGGGLIAATLDTIVEAEQLGALVARAIVEPDLIVEAEQLGPLQARTVAEPDLIVETDELGLVVARTLVELDPIAETETVGPLEATGPIGADLSVIVETEELGPVVARTLVELDPIAETEELGPVVARALVQLGPVAEAENLGPLIAGGTIAAALDTIVETDELGPLDARTLVQLDEIAEAEELGPLDARILAQLSAVAEVEQLGPLVAAGETTPVESSLVHLQALPPARLITGRLVQLVNRDRCACAPVAHIARTAAGGLDAFLYSTTTPVGPAEATLGPLTGDEPPPDAHWTPGIWLTPWQAATGRRWVSFAPAALHPAPTGIQWLWIRWTPTDDPELYLEVRTPVDLVN